VKPAGVPAIVYVYVCVPSNADARGSVDVDNDAHGRSHCVLVCVSSRHRMWTLKRADARMPRARRDNLRLRSMNVARARLARLHL
jgi:hypothetical protein